MTTEGSRTADERLRVAGGLLVSGLLIAALVVAVAALGTNILGVLTYYGNGMDSRLGGQVARDFLADQDAEAIALSSADPSALSGRLTENALSDVSQQISDQATSGSTPTVAFQAGSLTVLRAQDPVDPSLVIEVQEDGTRSVVTSGGPNAAPTQQTISFHGNFWLRRDSTGRYLIADQNIQNQPFSIVPAATVVVAALAAVALAWLLFVRERARRLSPALAATSQPIAAVMPPLAVPEEVALPEADGPAPDMTVKTFSALQIKQAGNDWAQALTSRPVTGFVWLRLLVAAIQSPPGRMARDEIARQTNPRASRDVQLKRLRNVVGKGLPQMPATLRERILVGPEVMAFRLDGCRVDAIELLGISHEFERTSTLMPAQAARIENLLRDCQGAFLPEFEAIEDLTTDHLPTCTTLIRELRDLLVNKRVQLSLLCADTYVRSGRTASAISLLESAHSDRPDRKDIADLLASAYRSAGRDAEATAVAARYV